MNLAGLLPVIERNTDYRKLVESYYGSHEIRNTLVISNPARSYLIASLHVSLKVPMLVVTATPEAAKKIYEELIVWSPVDTPVHLYPETDFLVTEFSSFDSGAVVDRLQTLATLVQYNKRKDTDVASPVIVCPASAVISHTIPQAEFARAFHTIKVGMEIEPLTLISRWQQLGYELEYLAEVPGTISHRGGIVDIYPMQSDLPARLEFFGNCIDSIRQFDPKTQRSISLIDSILVIPARENSLQLAGDTLLDYLPADTLLILDEHREIQIAVDTINRRYKEFRDSGNNNESTGAGSQPLYLTAAEFDERIGQIRQHLELSTWNGNIADNVQRRSIPFISLPSYGGKLDFLIKDISVKLQNNQPVVVISQQTNRLVELLQENDILACSNRSLEHVPQPGTLTLIYGSLDEGWGLDGNLIVLTDNELFGLVKQRRLFKKRPVRHHRFITELTAGDFVVHIDHGIGKYTGLVTLSTEGLNREYLVLEYSAGDKLYVPTDQFDRVSPYIGGTDQAPSLNRLGTQEWTLAKQRIKKSVIEMAEELLKLYATRETARGHAFSRDGAWQQEMESSFPYAETPDQLEAVQAVKADMEIEKPMDRLVCGDVGYGKTEIALRAAFKAIMDGKQVALLVPTTVLAQQHLFTFIERLQSFPVSVEVLSRFASEKEQERIILGLSTGTVDICIGTHRLLQKDVVFKNLGLLIIDEEQRFGVVHKEYFKKLRQEIDILTLSATPIPRTLHMALSGIRNLSVMETPPENRLPIKTFVGPYDETLIREAILRELERNGQVFFIHNRIFNIYSIAEKLHHLVPEARIAVAHGRLQEELEEIMADFALRKSDVLLTTTIIESGLDMPNVNTLIIDESDKLGLTQLYQLRGRIGRGSNTAYAYFLFDRGKLLTPQARKRLTAIAEATELGAGFAIAMKDLEIRGSGNLLGAAQSGYIASVGFDLYCRLLNEAVEELRLGQKSADMPVLKESDLPAPSVILPLDYHIPSDYISDENFRIRFYQKLASVKDSSGIELISAELKDRFGTLPQSAENLLYAVRIRQLATEAHIESIISKEKQIIINFLKSIPAELSQLLTVFGNGIKLGNRQLTLDLRQFTGNWQEALLELLKAVVRAKE